MVQYSISSVLGTLHSEYYIKHIYIEKVVYISVVINNFPLLYIGFDINKLYMIFYQNQGGIAMRVLFITGAVRKRGDL